uniref:Uncharacterized protein n=1 Tax=Arundo donax TaxID=35708 RepID=A0A0A9ELY5_ARUDO
MCQFWRHCRLQSCDDQSCRCVARCDRHPHCWTKNHRSRRLRY